METNNTRNRVRLEGVDSEVAEVCTGVTVT